MQNTTLIISGMHCSSCSKIIESALEEKDGITSVAVNFDSKKAILEFNEQKTTLDEIKKEIESLGYRAV